MGTDDGIEVGDEFSHTGDQGHLPEFASGHQTFVKGTNGRVEASRGERRHVQRTPHLEASAGYASTPPAGTRIFGIGYFTATPSRSTSRTFLGDR